MFLNLSKKTYKKLFFITAGIVLVLALIPNSDIGTSSDKLNHIIAFFTLSLLLNRASSTLNARLRNMLALIIFGISIEVFQYFTTYRSSDYKDVVADGVGILLFQLLLSLYRAYKHGRAYMRGV